MCSNTAKVVLIVISTGFWLLAGCLFAVGSIVFAQYRHYEQIEEAWYTLVPALLLLGVGMLFVLIGVAGCVGACKEQRCLLGMFGTTLIIIITGLVVSVILAYVYKKQAVSDVKTGVDKLFNNYGMNNSEAVTDQVDFIQQKLQCCGRHNYTDWQNTWWYHNQKGEHMLYPNSCCPVNTNGSSLETNGTYCGIDKVFPDGCYDLVENVFLNYLTISAGGAVAILAIMVLGVVFTGVLVCKKRELIPTYSILSDDNMHV